MRYNCNIASLEFWGQTPKTCQVGISRICHLNGSPHHSPVETRAQSGRVSQSASHSASHGNGCSLADAPAVRASLPGQYSLCTQRWCRLRPQVYLETLGCGYEGVPPISAYRPTHIRTPSNPHLHAIQPTSARYPTHICTPPNPHLHTVRPTSAITL